MRRLKTLRGESNRLSVERLRERLRPYFSSRSEVLLAYVFGSTSSGRQTPLSDVDLAILVDQKQFEKLDRQRPYGYQAEVLSDLMVILKRDDIDLVILNQADPLLRHRAVNGGQTLFCRDERLQIGFEVNVLGEYLDTCPLRALQAHYLRARIDRGRFGKVGENAMIDQEIIERHLQSLEEAVRVLHQYERYSQRHLETDVATRYTVEHAFQLAIQNLLDIGRHILSALAAKGVKSYNDIAQRLAEHKILTPSLARKLTGMAKLRNILVHGYIDVDVEKLHRFLENLDDFDALAKRLRYYLAKQS